MQYILEFDLLSIHKLLKKSPGNSRNSLYNHMYLCCLYSRQRYARKPLKRAFEMALA